MYSLLNSQQKKKFVKIYYFSTCTVLLADNAIVQLIAKNKGTNSEALNYVGKFHLSCLLLQTVLWHIKGFLGYQFFQCK